MFPSRYILPFVLSLSLMCFILSFSYRRDAEEASLTCGRCVKLPCEKFVVSVQPQDARIT